MEQFLPDQKSLAQTNSAYVQQKNTIWSKLYQNFIAKISVTKLLSIKLSIFETKQVFILTLHLCKKLIYGATFTMLQELLEKKNGQICQIMANLSNISWIFSSILLMSS